jgi:hypothetical protein
MIFMKPVSFNLGRWNAERGKNTQSTQKILRPMTRPKVCLRKRERADEYGRWNTEQGKKSQKTQKRHGHLTRQWFACANGNARMITGGRSQNKERTRRKYRKGMGIWYGQGLLAQTEFANDCGYVWNRRPSGTLFAVVIISMKPPPLRA